MNLGEGAGGSKKMGEILIETNEYKLNKSSSSKTGPVVIYVSNEHFGNAGDLIKADIDTAAGSECAFYELLVNDWDKYLSPWECDAGMNGRAFQGQARHLLENVLEYVIPKIRERQLVDKVYIAGYSLAGLFSLWCLYECDAFDGAACCSGSLWYPGWSEYAMSHSLQKPGRVYLSLGKKEKKTKHPLMRTVEDNLMLQRDILEKDEKAEKMLVEFNEGGHFDNTNERMVKGIKWLLGS